MCEKNETETAPINHIENELPTLEEIIAGIIAGLEKAQDEIKVQRDREMELPVERWARDPLAPIYPNVPLI